MNINKAIESTKQADERAFGKGIVKIGDDVVAEINSINSEKMSNEDIPQVYLVYTYDFHKFEKSPEYITTVVLPNEYFENKDEKALVSAIDYLLKDVPFYVERFNNELGIGIVNRKTLVPVAEIQYGFYDNDECEGKTDESYSEVKFNNPCRCFHARIESKIENDLKRIENEKKAQNKKVNKGGKKYD